MDPRTMACFSNKCEKDSKYQHIKLLGTCTESNVFCYSSHAGPTGSSLYKKFPSCTGAYNQPINDDCYESSEDCLIKCRSNYSCVRNEKKPDSECILKCCTKPNEKPKICEGGGRCCLDETDCSKVPSLAVILADMWNEFLMGEKTKGYTGPFITGMAFDKEGSGGYTVPYIAECSRETIYGINQITKVPNLSYSKLMIDNQFQQFVLSVTKDGQFSGSGAFTINGLPSAAVTSAHSVQDLSNYINGILQTGIKGGAPSIMDEELPEYYNLMDKCTIPNEPVLVDSLPNWKYQSTSPSDSKCPEQSSASGCKKAQCYWTGHKCLEKCGKNFSTLCRRKAQSMEKGRNLLMWTPRNRCRYQLWNRNQRKF